MTSSGAGAFVTESLEFWQRYLMQKGGGWLALRSVADPTPGGCTSCCRPTKPTDHNQNITMLTLLEYVAIIY